MPAKKPKLKVDTAGLFNKTLDAMGKISKASDGLINLGLIALGWQRFKDWKGALVGPISLKLAQAPGLPSQLAGVAGLAFLGASFTAGQDLDPDQGGGRGFWEQATNQKCPPGWVLDWNILRGWHCVKVTGPIG